VAELSKLWPDIIHRSSQALGERIKPVLTVNKLDRLFLELMLDGEEAYQGFRYEELWNTHTHIHTR